MLNKRSLGMVVLLAPVVAGCREKIRGFGGDARDAQTSQPTALDQTA